MSSDRCLRGPCRRCRARRGLVPRGYHLRHPMHPADRVISFTGLAQACQSVSVIAARFGVSGPVVERGLPIGHTAPGLPDTRRGNGIDLEVSRTFAVTADHAPDGRAGTGLCPRGCACPPGSCSACSPGSRCRADPPRRLASSGPTPASPPGKRSFATCFAREEERGIRFEDPVVSKKCARATFRAGRLLTS